MTNPSPLVHPKLTAQVRTHFYLLASTDAHAARRYLGGALGVKKSQRNDWAKRLMEEAGVKPVERAEARNTQDSETVTTRVIGDEFSAEVEISREQTLEEVIQLCNVDLTKWEPKGFSLTRKKSGFGWNARFSKKTAEIGMEAITAAFEVAGKAHAPKKWTVQKAGEKERDCIYVLNLQDWHAGKLAHGRETGGADWDIKIAEKEYRSAVDDLMSKVPIDRVEEVVVIIGSDAIQVDNNASTTTAGTYVDSDSRLSKIFDVAAKTMTDVIETIATKARVRAVVLRGNHDETVSLFLGKYVEAWFRSHPNVIVDSSPQSRKYVGYGKVLLGFDHGDGAKAKNLPLLVMRENQSVISQYRFVEVLTGHYHTEQSDDYTGVIVRVAPALCAADRWHSKMGFQGSIRRAQGLLYQKEDGLQAIYYSRALD